MEMKLFKPFAEWAINLLGKYRNDLFFRTVCHIIILQILLTAVLIATFWLSLRYLSEGVTREFIEMVAIMLRGGEITTESFSANLRQITAEYFFPAAAIVIATTLCFGFLTTYAALTPARRSLERKKRFIGNIAHELRTPLAIVRTNTDVALMDASMSPSIRDVLLGNIREMNRITEIMNNLLSLNKVMILDDIAFSKVDLVEVAERAIEYAQPIAKQKNIKIACGCDRTDVLAVWGNPVTLEQVVFNLLKNAVTYTHGSGAINVTVKEEREGYVDLVVRDNGIGIAQEDLYHIFEPFYRSRKAPRETGSGLGLTIVSEIVRMHRGKINIQSKKGHGTSVTVSIPKIRAGSHRGPTAQRPTGTKHKDVGENVSMDFSGSFFRE